MEDLIVSQSSERNWPGCVAAVKANDRACTGDVRLLVDYSLLAAEIPLKLIVRAPAGLAAYTIVAHSEIRDLGGAPHPAGGVEFTIAGLSNTVVAEGYRRQGIYTALIKLRNIILDQSSGFDCVAALVKKGYEQRYRRQYPGFKLVKEEDQFGAAWLIRVLPGIVITESEMGRAITYLETEVKKW